MRVLRACAAMLDRAFKGTQRLRPLTVLTSIPEQEWRARRRGNRHRALAGRAHALAQRRAVLEVAIRLMTRAAGDFSVRAQAGVEEQAFAKPSCARIVRDAIGRVGRQRLEFGDSQRAELVELRRRPMA